MIDTKKYGLTDLSSDELLLTNGGEAGDFIGFLAYVGGVAVAVLEYIGKNIAEGDNGKPAFTTGMK